MRLTWSTGQILAVAVFGVVLVAISGYLELTSAVRSQIDGARAEAVIVSRTLLSQISHVAQGTPADPLGAVGRDPGIALILQSAAEQAPSVDYVAVCDTSNVAIAHTTPEMLGRHLEPNPPLPAVEGPREASRLLFSSLTGPAPHYEVATPLSRGDHPFGVIRVGVAGALVRDRANQVFHQALRIAGIEIAMAAILGFVMAGVARRRFAEIGAGVTALREGRYGEQIRESGIAEFSRLARDLNLLSRQFQEERSTHLGTFQQAVDLIGEGLLALGPGREIVLLNEAAARVLGISAGSSRGKRLEEILPPEHPVRRLVERLFVSSEPTLSIDLPGENGESALVAVCHRVMEADSRGGILVQFRKQASLREIHTYVDHSRVLMRMGEMAAGVAHEIRNSLQTLHFELGQLRDSAHQGSQDVEERVRVSLGELQRLENAVTGFLKIARLRQIQVAPLSPNDLLAEIGDIMDVEAKLGGLNLALELADESVQIVGDRGVLRQALQNLVKNAIQAQPSKDHRIVLSSRFTDRAVKISVSDTGPGIPAEILDRVTDLYFTTRDTGSGVGLALARQAIEMHGGELGIESEKGEGTTVTLSLPSRAPGQTELQET